MQISELQNENLKLIKQVLLKIVVTHPHVEFAGTTEPYILVKVSDLEIYLYHDGEANLIRKKSDKVLLDKRFELPDYSGPTALVNDLIRDIQNILNS